MSMTQKQIRRAAMDAKDEIKRCRGEVEVAIAKWRVVIAQCSHPDTYKTSCMGDSGTHCPDCGHST